MQSVHVNGVRLNVLIEGVGPSLLFVHGFPFNHSMWVRQIGRFSRTHRVIAPDLRGFGRSDVTDGRVTMEDFADDLAALLEAVHTKEPVVYCGLSMGGYIAWAFARKYPERLRALILCGTRAAADAPEAVQERMLLAERVLIEGTEDLAVDFSAKLFARETYTQQPQVVEEMKRVMRGSSPEGIAAALIGMAERPDATEELSTITVPTLLIVGEEDGISPRDEMRSMAEALPNAELVRVAGAGHLAPLERPAEVNAAIGRFLATVTGRS